MKKSVLFLVTVSFITLTISAQTEVIKKAYRDYLGKIVFSDQEIRAERLDKDQLSNQFELLDNIYAGLYMKKTLKEAYEDNNYEYNFDMAKNFYNYALRLYVDDSLEAQWLFEMPEEDFDQVVTLDFVISSKEKYEKRNYSGIVNQWVGVISQLPGGKHNITFEMLPLSTEMVGNELPVLASGSFTLNVNPSKIADFEQRMTTSLPIVTMIDKDIQDQIVRASNDLFDQANPIRALITDKKGDWTYVKDENDIILYRHIVASVVYRFLTDGSCWIKSAWYTQEHQGYGKFDPVQYSREAEGYYNYRIPCDNVFPANE